MDRSSHPLHGTAMGTSGSFQEAASLDALAMLLGIPREVLRRLRACELCQLSPHVAGGGGS